MTETVEYTYHCQNCNHPFKFVIESERAVIPIPGGCNPKDDPQMQASEKQRYSASYICYVAGDIVEGDRAAQHGPKERSFENIAIMWRAYMALKCANGEDPAELTAYDVGMMMITMKQARCFAGAGRTNLDNYVDIAGFAGCTGEIALEETK